MTNKAYRYIAIIITSLVLLAGIFAGVNYVLHLNRYVVKVNGQGVSVDEFKVYMKIVKSQKEKLAGITNTDEIKKFWTEPVEGLDPMVFARQEALDSVINLIIISKKAKEKGIQSSEMDEALLRAKLESQGFIKELKDIGIEEKYIKGIIKNLSLRLKLYNSLTQGIVLNDSEFKKILESNADSTKQYNVRHILLLTIDENQKELPLDKQEQIKKQAEKILERVQKGEDFSKLAAEYSQDPGSKDKGGKYSFFKGEADKNFQDAVFKLKIGENSGLVKSFYGYHIIKLDSISNPNAQDLERIKLRIRDSYTEQKRNAYFDEQMAKWKQEAHIEKNEQLINSINVIDLK
ncbi:MAG: peptidylprolyl isomerase [Ignavibacteriales bacterium]